MSLLKLRVQPPDANNLYQVFELEGDMDRAGLDIVQEKLDKTADNYPLQYFVFDFTELNYINSESIGFIMSLHSKLSKMKKNLIIASAKAHVKDVLSVIGVLGAIEYYDSLEDFKKKIA